MSKTVTTKATKKQDQDKTSANQNSKAKAITYPAKGKDLGDAKKIRKENRDIDFHFSDSEKQKMGIDLAHALLELVEIEGEKKQVVDGFKNRLDAKQAVINTLTKELDAGFATRLVTCEVKLNFDSGFREYWIGDVKRDEEPLFATDHELDLFDTDTKSDPKAVKGKVFDIRLIAGDFAVTKKGTVIEITADDELNGIDYTLIDRLATQPEIDEFISKKNIKKK